MKPIRRRSRDTFAFLGFCTTLQLSEELSSASSTFVLVSFIFLLAGPFRDLGAFFVATNRFLPMTTWHTYHIFRLQTSM